MVLGRARAGLRRGGVQKNERTKQLSAIGRQERAGPDKRGEVYQELSSTEEETPSRRHLPSPSSPLLPPTVETVCRKYAAISVLIQSV